MSSAHEFDALYARLDDLSERARRGEVGISDFLSPREQHFAAAYLKRGSLQHIGFGGYAGAERKRIYILPEYIDAADGIEGLAEFGFEAGICAVKIKPSGFRLLTHRDYLGTVLSLGIERSVIGDILLDARGEAILLCSSEMQAFLLSSIERIANDKVRTSACDVLDITPPERKFEQINDTVASARLDCVVGAICSLSRERAKQAVVGGLVEIDFECEERPDRMVEEGATVSVRGYGRYRINALSDKTRKGRYRLSAEKFI